MKKLFVSILALSAFIACQSDYSDVNLETPQGGNVHVAGSHTIYAEVGIGGETKATYDGDLKAMWEENDQIALLQEHADYGTSFTGVNPLAIKSGWGTSSAAFSGDITVDATAPRVYHIAYPVSAVSFSTSMTQEIAGVTYSDNLGVAGNQFTATGYGVCTYNSTLNITVPASQSGKWEPYMYGSTDESVSSNGIGAKTLNTLTGAIGIRAYENDGVTSKQLKSITIESDKPIAGLFSGTATSVGNTATITGEESAWYVAGEKYWYEAREEALSKLTSALQSYEATETSVTKAMSLSFSGNVTAINASVESIAADANGVYTYYINVAPFSGANLTLTVVAEDGSKLIRTINDQSIEASHSRGYNIKWESASLTVGTIDTWYDSYAGNHSTTLAGNTIYVNDLEVKGVPAEQVESIGVVVYDENGGLVGQYYREYVTSVDQLAIELSSGRYMVRSYAYALANGVQQNLLGEDVWVNVTAIPSDNSVIQTSYSKNGSRSLTNAIGGTTLECTPSFGDIPASCISSCQFVYGSNTQNVTNGTKSSVNVDLGQYSCYVKIVLGNGYTYQSSSYTTHVTGIPYTLSTSSNDGTWSESGYVNWNSNGGVRLGLNQWGGEAYIQRSFHIPANLTVKVTSNGVVNGTGSWIKVDNTATITVGSTTVVSKTQSGNNEVSWSCSNASAAMTSSSNTVKCNSSYNLEKAKVVIKALNITY